MQQRPGPAHRRAVRVVAAIAIQAHGGAERRVRGGGGDHGHGRAERFGHDHARLRRRGRTRTVTDHERHGIRPHLHRPERRARGGGGGELHRLSRGVRHRPIEAEGAAGRCARAGTIQHHHLAGDRGLAQEVRRGRLRGRGQLQRGGCGTELVRGHHERHGVLARAVRDERGNAPVLVLEQRLRAVRNPRQRPGEEERRATLVAARGAVQHHAGSDGNGARIAGAGHGRLRAAGNQREREGKGPEQPGAGHHDVPPGGDGATGTGCPRRAGPGQEVAP